MNKIKILDHRVLVNMANDVYFSFLSSFIIFTIVIYINMLIIVDCPVYQFLTWNVR